MNARSPLRGRRVVVTRPQEQAPRLGRLLRDAGAEPLLFPTIAIADPDSWSELDRAIAELRSRRYDWVLFTSVNAATRLLDRVGRDLRAALGSVQVGAVGGATACALNERGIEVDLVAPGAFARSLAAAVGAGSGRVLLPRAVDAPRAVVEDLRALGWNVDEVAAYRNVLPPPDPAIVRRLRARQFDVVIFTSPSTARNFVTLVGAPADLGLREGGDERLVACIGPSSAEAARALGFRVDVVATERNDAGMVAALERHLTGREMAR